MAQKTQQVIHGYVEERDRKEWRRRCKVCGKWTIVHYKAANPCCDACQKLPKDNAKKGVPIELLPHTFYFVVYCPDEYGYSKGAAFSAAEMREMRGHDALIPGMILERSGKRYKVNDRYDLLEHQ